jgi:hypothetical protein
MTRRMLPYLYDSTLLDQAGTSVLDNIPVSVWPAGNQQSTTSGESFDHTGEAPSRFNDDLSASNLTLILRDGGPLTGKRFKVVGATGHPHLPHVALELRRVTPGGGQF